MKAVVYQKSKGLVYKEDAPAPELEPGQVLVKVSNCGFCGSDHSMVESGNLAEDYILGHEFSGTVVEAGTEAEAPAPGTRVIVRPTWCGECADCKSGNQQFCQNNRRTTGIGDLPGGFAEYVVAYPQMLIPVPDGVDSRNAALAEMFAASYHGINVSKVKGGSVLVLGGGPIGLALVQLLKVLGFGPIALSEPVEEKRELGKKMGADRVNDPFNEPLGACVLECTGGNGFDSVFECSGVPSNIQASMDAVTRYGTVCVLSVIGKEATIWPVTLNFKEIWLIAAYGNIHAENKQILEWMAQGLLDGRPMISDLIGLEDLPETYKNRIHTGKAVKVMLRIGEEF